MKKFEVGDYVIDRGNGWEKYAMKWVLVNPHASEMLSSGFPAPHPQDMQYDIGYWNGAEVRQFWKGIK